MLHLTWLIIFIPESTMAARILCIYPTPFDSHHFVFRRLTEELAKDGHHLVVLTPLPHEISIPNVTEIDVHDISYKMWDQTVTKKLSNRNTFKIDSETGLVHILYNTVYPIFDAQLSVPDMKKIIHDETQHFDLILVEASVRATLIVSARFKAPVIMISSYLGLSYNYDAVGATVDPSFFPDFLYVKKSNNIYFWNKLSPLYLSMKFRFLQWQAEKIENALIKKHFGEEAPTMAELTRNIQMLILNVHHVWDFNRPVPPNVLYLGALHLKEPKPLPQDLKEYLDMSINGVVYMSLGSKIESSNLPVQTIHLILKVFASLPYNVIWKWNGPEIPNKPKNLRLEKWLPQNDMLHHSNIKMFITQAGLQSTDEAITARVPVIGLPILADQYLNSDKYEEFGIGIALDIDDLDENSFRKAILEVAENKNYRKNIDKLAQIMEVERFGALEKALRWINHTATYGAHQLRSPLVDLSLVQYYSLDIIVAVALIILVIIISVTILLRCVMTKFFYLMKHKYKLKAHRE